jgi:hypothetical protein
MHRIAHGADGTANRVTPTVHDRSMNETTITISCESCIMQHTTACDDCVVTFFDRTDNAVVFDIAEQRAVRLLVAAGLVPSLKHREAI